MITENVLELSREFEASIIYVKHSFSHSRIDSDIVRGFRTTALTSGLRQKELEYIHSEDVLRYVENAAKAFAIVSSLSALDQSPKLGLRPFVIELGYNDIRKQLWEKVLQQFKLPSGIVELFRQSYSPVVLQDGSLILPVTRDELMMDPKSFIFSSFNDANIAKVYSSGLVASTRTDVFDAIPMVYQHIASGYHVDSVFDERYEFSVDNDRVDKAVAKFVQAKESNGKLDADALKVRDVLSEHGIDYDALGDKTQLSSVLEYSWFEHKFYKSKKKKVEVSPARDVPDMDIDSDLFLPVGYEDLIRSGQIFASFSRIEQISQQLINDRNDRDGLKEITSKKVIGGINLESEMDVPLILDKSLKRYSVGHYNFDVVCDWWFNCFAQSK